MEDNAARLVQLFEAAEDATQAARAESERCRDYKDGRQLTADQIKALKKRKQPIVIENLIRPKVDYLCGLERQTRTDPKAWPRTVAHEQDAEAATDALRYVASDQNIDIKRSQVFENMLVEGFGGVEVGVRRATGNAIDPSVDHIAWDRLFYDPHSSQADFSDADYLGFVTWMDLPKAKRRWPGNDAVLDATMAKAGAATETYDDKPRKSSWADPRRKRVRIVTIYELHEGQWCRAVFTQAGELEPLAPSPFVDEEGRPECALLMQSANVDRDNDRYGLVRDYLSLQDEVNKRRSKFLHLSNSRPMRLSPSSGMDPETARAEFNRPDGILMAEQGQVEDLTSQTMAAGHFNLLAEAKQAIQAVGPNATMQGKSGQDQSGRAILALQQGGMTEVAPLLDNLRHFNIRLFRMLWNRIRQFWTEERWVRVTDDEKGVRFVGFNAPRGQIAGQKVYMALQEGKIDEAQAAQFAQQIMAMPGMDEPANMTAEMDVDIDIDEVPNAATLQFEQFDQLTKLIPAAPPPYIPAMFKMMIEASSLRDKDKLRKIAEEMEQPQQPDPMAAMQAEMAMQGAQAGIEKTQSETAKNMATAQKTQVETVTGAAAAGYGMGAAA